MHLWRGFISRFAQGIRTWQIWFAIVFSVVGIVANSAPIFDSALQNRTTGPLTSMEALYYVTGLLYALLSVVAVPVLGWTFYRRIRSGRGQLRLSPAYRRRFSWQFVYSYGVAKVLLFVVVIPALALTLFGLVGAVNYLVSPHFAQDQQSVNAGQNYLLGLAMSALASLEELWRWAMIASVVYAVRWLLPRLWRTSVKARRIVFIAAIVISSFFFGVAHVAEFGAAYQWMALVVLGSMGVMLTAVAILTRRLWIAMLVHAAYDFIVMTNLSNAVAPWIIGAALGGVFIIIPFVNWGHNEIAYVEGS